MVVLPYRYDPDNGELPIAQSISTGLACHRSPEEAAVSAICEVIERDAFTITWQARLDVPRIRTETLSDRSRDLVERFERTGSAVVLFNLAMDHGVPTILSVLRAWNAGEPALVFAASTDPDPEKAARKSLEELAHTRRLAQQLTADLPPLAAAPDYENVVNQDCHVRLYCDQANVPLADFLFASDERVDFHGIGNLATGDPGRDLEILVGKVRAVNHRVLLADLTTEDVESLGLAVVRALIPGFHPLFMRHSLRALGGARLYEVPQELGYEGITRESGDNSAPHPYP
jgi:ribosomal protein S12 methylthiotransferase accessory factor